MVLGLKKLNGRKKFLYAAVLYSIDAFAYSFLKGLGITTAEDGRGGFPEENSFKIQKSAIPLKPLVPYRSKLILIVEKS